MAPLNDYAVQTVFSRPLPKMQAASISATEPNPVNKVNAV